MIFSLLFNCVYALDLSGVWYREDYAQSLRDDYVYNLTKSWDEDTITATPIGGSYLFTGKMQVLDDKTVSVLSDRNGQIRLRKFDFTGDWISNKEYREKKDVTHSYFVTKIQSKQATITDKKSSPITGDLHLRSVSLIKIGNEEYVRKTAIFYDIQDYERKNGGIWYFESPDPNVYFIFPITFYLQRTSDNNGFYNLNQSVIFPSPYEYEKNSLYQIMFVHSWAWDANDYSFSLVSNDIMKVHKISRRDNKDCGYLYLKRFDFAGEWCNYSEYKALGDANKTYTIVHYRQNAENIKMVNNTIGYYDEKTIINNAGVVSVSDKKSIQFSGNVLLINENHIRIEGIDYVRKSSLAAYSAKKKQ